MNKRIQELALQAGAKLGPYVHNVSLLQPDGTYKWDEDRHTDTTTMDLDKFAELIVRECMTQCADNGSNDEWDKGVRWSAEQIKQHFGVK